MQKDPPDPSAGERRDEAARWWTRLDGGALSQAEWAAFRAWLARDAANERAFEAVCELWGKLEALREPLRRAPSPPSPAPRRRWAIAAAAVGASFALILGFDELRLICSSDYRTGVGELKTLALPDGSHAQLNARSALALSFRGGERRVNLLAGEAVFEVAADPARPFVVEAGGGTVTARGTAFDVAIEGARTVVTVTERSVEIERRDQKLVVSAGQQTAFGSDSPALPPYAVDADEALAWRRGRLIFQDQALGDVVAALGRYHHGVVLIPERELRERRISGAFDVGHAADALLALEKSLDVRALHFSPLLTILYL